MTGGGGWISKSRRLGCYIRGDFRCVYCQRDLRTAKPFEMTLDHLEDLVVGGGHAGANHASTNLVLACTSCNSSRRNTEYTVFAAKFDGAAERIETQRHALVNLEMAKAIIAGK